MNVVLRPALVALFSLPAVLAQGVEANFQATFRVYDSPSSTPTVAYEVPAGGNYSFYSDREVADDVELAGNGRIIAGVTFEYYANYALTAGLTFRMYERSANGVPGTLVYSLPLDILQGGGIVNIDFTYDATNILPQRFFYSVQFNRATTGGNVAGMILPDRKATTGSSADRLLEKRGNAWLPIDLNAGRGLRLGLRKSEDGRKVRMQVVAEPRTRLKVEAVRNLGEVWSEVAEVVTDDAGVGEFDSEIDTGDVAFFRTVAP
jgi:hypothetical protein